MTWQKTPLTELAKDMAGAKTGATRARAKRLQMAGRPAGADCDLCGKPFGLETPRFDHDHKTGLFRGWIHHKCNVALGTFGDDIPGVQRALDYLTRTTSQKSDAQTVIE